MDDDQPHLITPTQPDQNPAAPPVPVASPAPAHIPEPPAPASPPAAPPRSRKKLRLIPAIVVVLVLVAAGSVWTLHQHHAHKTTTSVKLSHNQTSASTAKVQGLQLAANKNYGNKYANGLLPVGDGQYSTTTPKVDYVYACSQYAQKLSSSQGGAQTRGPWFTDNNTEYNINQKTHVAGSVMWQASFTDTVSGTTRTIVTNDLPSHPTGVFPILSSDPAYAYDRNPNSIKSQSLTYQLNANPAYGSPNCMGGEAGIMLTGVALFNAFDAGGRDAGAWEVQDACSGHPQSDGIYHYHTLSACIKNTSVQTVIGYALDGFPITGPQVGPNNILTTADLDVCHGLTSPVKVNNKLTTMYHYVMTEDFPYSVSCFRGTAIQPPDLSGQAAGSNAQPASPAGANTSPAGQLPPPRPGGNNSH